MIYPSHQTLSLTISPPTPHYFLLKWPYFYVFASPAYRKYNLAVTDLLQNPPISTYSFSIPPQTTKAAQSLPLSTNQKLFPVFVTDNRLPKMVCLIYPFHSSKNLIGLARFFFSLFFDLLGIFNLIP